MSSENNIFKHLPTVLLGVIVGAIFLVAVFSYQVATTESVVVTTFGQVEPVNPAPGLHFRWPYPIQQIFKFDKRARCFEGTVGKLEETQTADGQNVIVGLFVIYRIENPTEFYRTCVTVEGAEKNLNIWMRSSKGAVFGRYRYNQIINSDSKKMLLGVMQNEIREEIAKTAKNFGIAVDMVGIPSIGVPTTISDKVFERMVDDRKVTAQTYLSEGQREAQKIRIDADSRRELLLAQAEAKAKTTRAEGDAEAAKYYAVFKENPELAAFLRKLDALRKIMKNRTTLVLDTNTVPFDTLKTGAELLPAAQK